MRARYSLPLAALLLVMSAIPSFAGLSVPSPSNSTVPHCLVTSPDGIFPFSVTVRDFSNLPIGNSVVVIDFTDCAAVVPCAASANDGYQLDAPNHRILAVTGIIGGVSISFRAGGGCSGSVVRVYADGVLLALVRVASADQNGDLTVDGADIGLANSKIGTADLSGDLDCNGGVDAADVALVTNRVGESCAPPTETRRGTWGSLKTIYR
jgi:hypothetical protein